jgi:hypothetical protein
MLDAYTVRKAVPRLVLAVIMINLSIYLCVAAIDITNVVAKGLGQLIVSPFLSDNSFAVLQLEENDTNTAFGIFGAGGALATAVGLIWASGGIAVAGIAVLGLLLPLLVTISLIALAVLFTIIIRTGLLIFLTVISPVAIACFVLPGTEKYFRQWWSLFFKTLLVYPIIMAVLAVANVLGAILLGTAGSQAGSVGLAQIIGAILALYAPLVLIPFAFKFAGGMIGTLMNAAEGRTRGWSNRAGQAIAKNRQDPNTFLGSRAARARANRAERGFTPGQMVAGTLGGMRNVRAGRSFRSGYRAGSSSIGSVKSYDEASNFMQNNAAFNQFKGNDDALWAFMNGRDEASVRSILQRRGVTDPQALADTTALIMRAKNQVGEQAGLIAATRAQAATGTGFEDNAQMLQSINAASGGDMNIGGRMLAEMRGAATQSGRIELGTSSFNTQMIAMSRLADAATGGPAYSAADAEQDVMESVIDSNTAGYAVHGKPQSARAIGRAHTQKITNLLHSLSTGQATDVNGVSRVATSRDVKQAIAAANGIHDAMAQASPQNAREFADQVMGAGINVQALSPEARAALGPAWGMEGQGESSLGPEGNLTIRQIMDNLGGKDQEYMEMRRDYATQTAGEAAEQRRLLDQQRQAAQQNPSQPAPPTGQPPANPTAKTGP